MLRRQFLALAVGFPAATVVATANAADAAGSVTALTGKALAMGSGSERILAKGDTIHEGDLVQTSEASRLTLRLGKSTVVHLGPSTRLKVEPHLKEAGGVLELVDGNMLYDHVRGAPPTRSQIRTPYGLIAVRGTRFWGGRSNGVFGVFVDEGRVDVTGAGTTVRLTPGLGTDIAAPGAKPSRPGRWGAARVRRALLDTIDSPRMPTR